MSNSVYPLAVRGLTWPIMKTHNFASIVQRAPSAFEVRIAQEANPTWDFTLIYNYLKDNPADLVGSLSPFTDYQYLRGFLLARQGQFDSFLFNDIADNAVTAQTLQLVNDGAGTYYTPLQRNFGGQFYEDVTDLNPLNGSGLVVKANGVTQTMGTCGSGGTTFELHGPGLTIPGYSFTGMYLKWCSAPTAPITASFGFYFRVRLAMDSQDIEQFMTKLWTIGGNRSKNGSGSLKFTTARPPLP